jgi:hypothetical protein
MRGVRLLSVLVVALLVLSAGLAVQQGLGTGPQSAPLALFIETNSSPTLTPLPSPTAINSAATSDVPLTQSDGGAVVHVGNLSRAATLSPSFWGVNVAAQQPFGTADATRIAATPAAYIRFPGGDLGEEFNYTSGLITSSHGASSHAATSAKAFVTTCEGMDCHAILQLPAEIDQPQTAADYAYYVVHTLHFQPAYWEIGNSVPGWSHFNRSWSEWGKAGGDTITPSLFADLVGRYVTAVLAVDPKGHFIAFGSGMGAANYAEAWISDLAQVDGHQLSGVSIHSYVLGAGPSNPTWSDLLANLNGQYSLTKQVGADQAFLNAACPKCALKLFVTEVNAAEHNTYVRLIPTFAGALYAAAETAQALNLKVSNLDWFCYHGHYGGAWLSGDGHLQIQYTLFAQMMTQLGDQTLPATVTGPTSFYAAATLGPSGLTLLLVNVNMTHTLSVTLDNHDFASGVPAEKVAWLNGSKVPKNSSVTVGHSIQLPALSITVLTVGLGALLAEHAGRPAGAGGAHRAGTEPRALALPTVSVDRPISTVTPTETAPVPPAGLPSMTLAFVSEASGRGTKSPSRDWVPFRIAPPSCPPTDAYFH